MYSGYSFKWSNRHTAAALGAAASVSAVYAAYRLYRYHGYFSRAGIRPVSEGDLREVKRAVDEYLQFHYANAQEILPYQRSPKVRYYAPQGFYSMAWGITGTVSHCSAGSAALSQQTYGTLRAKLPGSPRLYRRAGSSHSARPGLCSRRQLLCFSEGIPTGRRCG